MSVKLRSHDRDAFQNTCRAKCTKTLTRAAESIAGCLVLLLPETSPSLSETLSSIQDVVLLFPSGYSTPSKTWVSSFQDVVLLLSRHCFSLLRGLTGWRVWHGRGWASIRVIGQGVRDAVLPEKAWTDRHAARFWKTLAVDRITASMRSKAVSGQPLCQVLSDIPKAACIPNT
jgi:hypothetical protein